MKSIKSYANAAYDYLLALVVFVAPFSYSVSNILLLLTVLVFIIDFDKRDFKAYSKTPFFVLAILVLYLYSQAIGNGTLMTDLSYYKKYIYLIVIPILFFRVKEYRFVKIAALLAVNITILISLYRFYNFYRKFHYIPFGNGWEVNFTLFLERPYAGVFCLLSIIISFDLYRNSSTRNYLFLLSLLLSVGFIFFISIRASILTLFVLLLVYIVFYFKAKIKYKLLLFTALIILFGLLFSFNKNIANRFFITDSIQKTIETTKEQEPRVLIVACAREIINQENFSFLFGSDSYASIQNQLQTCYESSIKDYSRKNWFIEQNFNSHNQFLDLFLIGGLIALLIFTYFLITLFFGVRLNFFAVSIVLTFMILLLFENVFHRQFGCFIFTIFAALYYREEKQK
jgi:O-antigen ligase